MNRATLFLLGSSVALAGCSSSNSHASMQGLTQSQADKMSATHAQITPAEDTPVTTATHMAAGQVAEAQGNGAAAINQYMAVLQSDPKNLDAMFRLGVVLTEVKQFDDAINIWQRYLKVSDRAALGYSNLGFCYELSGNTPKAEEAYKAGMSREPDNLVCKNNYALFLARQDRIDEATKVWQSFLSEARVHYNIASVYQMTGRRPLARDEFRQALMLDPDLHDAQARIDELRD